MNHNIADPHALAAARAAQAQVPGATVILFGSRATGRYHPGSDIDLLIVTNEQDPFSAEIKARKAALNYVKANPPRVPVDAIGIRRSQFERCRKANQHIAGQASRYGVIVSGENLDPAPSGGGRYPDHWPETRRRIERAEAWNQSLADVIENQHQELVGFTAQQAVENALKGWLSAYNSELFGFIRYPSPDEPEGYRDWLTDYAARYRYSGTAHIMASEEGQELQQLVNQFVIAAVARIHRLSGTDPSDV